MLKKLIIVSIIVAVLAAGGITIGTVIANQPETVVKTALSNTVEGLADRDEFSTVLEILEGGSVSVKNTFENSSVEGKIYFKNLMDFGKEEIYVDDLMIRLGGEQLNFSGYYSSDYAYISDCNLLSGVWGVIRGQAADSFLDSMFASDAGGPYAFTEEGHLAMMATLDFYDQNKEAAFKKDMDKLLNKYGKKIEKIFWEQALLEESKEKVLVDGDRMECRVIRITVDEKALAQILSQVYDILKNAKDIRKMFIEYGNDYVAMNGLNIDVVEYYEEQLINEEKWQELIKKVGEQELRFSMEVVTPKTSSVLRKLTLHLKLNEYNEDLLVLDFGKNGVKKAETISVYVNGHTYAYEIAENNKKLFEAYFYFDKEEVACLKVDRKNDTYQLTLTRREDFVISGEFVEIDHKMTITLDKIRIDGETISYNTRVTLNTKDPMPTPENRMDVTSVFEISETELNKLAKLIEEFFGDAAA